MLCSAALHDTGGGGVMQRGAAKSVVRRRVHPMMYTFHQKTGKPLPNLKTKDRLLFKFENEAFRKLGYVVESSIVGDTYRVISVSDENKRTSSGICFAASAYFVKCTLEKIAKTKDLDAVLRERKEMPTDHDLNIAQASFSTHWKTNLRATKFQDMCYRFDFKYDTIACGKPIISWRAVVNELDAAGKGVYFFMPYRNESSLHGMGFHRGITAAAFFDPNVGSHDLAVSNPSPSFLTLDLANHLKAKYDSYKTGGQYYIFRMRLE
jgi:hypothetical protein